MIVTIDCRSHYQTIYFFISLDIQKIEPKLWLLIGLRVFKFSFLEIKTVFLVMMICIVNKVIGEEITKLSA